MTEQNNIIEALPFERAASGPAKKKFSVNPLSVDGKGDKNYNRTPIGKLSFYQWLSISNRRTIFDAIW